MELGDSSTTWGPLALFCARLKRIQLASGVSQASLAGAAYLRKSQMSDILNGKIKRLPDWDVIIAVIRTCFDYAEGKGRPMPPELRDEEDWRRRYSDLEHDLDTVARPRTRREVLAGWLLADVTDPFALEVHRPVQPDTPHHDLSVLPAYMAREHDVELERVVAAAAQGSSEIAVLVGGSSTGKTRACWEVLRLLREWPKPWRLWHPIDPTRPEAALRDLPSIGPRTVVWLNEAQFYLQAPADGLGEQVAAGLRELLRDSTRAPVLVLATLWPQFWDRLTACPRAGEDPHAQARELLSGRDISVPSAFTAAQLQQLADVPDPRLALAASASLDGQVIQFLAGAPELLARCRNAPPAAAALINAAIDARRLGMGIALPLTFLEAAAPGYLTDTDWDALSEDWLEQALAYTAAPCKGVRGPLTRIRPRTTSSADTAPQSAYRLADYLDQYGRITRRSLFPSADFWEAAANFATAYDLEALAIAAEHRGLLRDAACLRKHAAAQGDITAAVTLIVRLHSLHPGEHEPAQWVAEHAALENPWAVARLLEALREADAAEQITVLASRAVEHAPLDDPSAVTWLLEALREADAAEQITVLLARDPAGRAPLDDPHDVAKLLAALRKADAAEQITVLLARDPAGRASLGDRLAVTELLDALREADAAEQVTVLASRAAEHAPLDDPYDVAWLLRALREADAAEQVAVLASRAAEYTPLHRPSAVAELLEALREVGAAEQITVLLARDPAGRAPSTIRMASLSYWQRCGKLARSRR